MVQPIWQSSPKAIRWFNYCYSLPRVWRSSLNILLGRVQIGAPSQPVALTCSISEDYARLWLYFARQALPAKRWRFVIVDSAGDMDAAKLDGAQVFRFLNVYHGQKVDLLLRKAICSEIVFLCDDDKYILSDVSRYLRELDAPNTPVVSLCPRTWWTFNIQGREFLPMGSYALLFKRHALLERNGRFQSPTKKRSACKVFPPNVKQQVHYDTADYLNEQLLLAGQNVATFPDNAVITGFSGLSGTRLVLQHYGSDYVRQVLREAQHYRQGSANFSLMTALHGIVKVERLYRKIFHEAPRLNSGFSETELEEILATNPHIEAGDRSRTKEHFAEIERIYQRLSELGSNEG